MSQVFVIAKNEDSMVRLWSGACNPTISVEMQKQAALRKNFDPLLTAGEFDNIKQVLSSSFGVEFHNSTCGISTERGAFDIVFDLYERDGQTYALSASAYPTGPMEADGVDVLVAVAAAIGCVVIDMGSGEVIAASAEYEVPLREARAYADHVRNLMK